MKSWDVNHNVANVALMSGSIDDEHARWASAGSLDTWLSEHNGGVQTARFARPSRLEANRQRLLERSEEAPPLGHCRGRNDAHCRDARLVHRRGLSCRLNSLIGVFIPSGTPHRATGTAGLPCTMVRRGTDLVTTLPALTTAP